MDTRVLIFVNDQKLSRRIINTKEHESHRENMIVKISDHLQKLMKKSDAVKKEFLPTDAEKTFSNKAFIDPLLEEKYTPVKGLCQKYPYRVLVELTLNCASFCRFCTRRRKVNDIKNGLLSKKDVSKIYAYIKFHPDIKEVIFSGGDPLMSPEILIYSLGKFAKLPQIKIIRVHTRVPVANPRLLTKKVLTAFTKVKDRPLYVSVHFEHPDELTPETIKAVNALRKTGAILLSQSVFLKGVNDSYETLKTLFTRLAELGVRPYYIYRCDLVKGVEHFIVPVDREIEIMTELRKNLSGIACPTYVIDTPNGFGKIPVPLNFWKFDKSAFKDFRDNTIKMY